MCIPWIYADLMLYVRFIIDEIDICRLQGSSLAVTNSAYVQYMHFSIDFASICVLFD